MRLWSLHPKYLDTKGLVALWRETLLAKHVLEGKTKGYKNHPQLNRFKEAESPIDSINQYLSEIYLEASKREFTFDKEKIDWNFRKSKLPVTTGQIKYESAHLLNKLEKRDPEKFHKVKEKTAFDIHPLFSLIEGDVEDWEVISDTFSRKQ